MTLMCFCVVYSTLILKWINITPLRCLCVWFVVVFFCSGAFRRWRISHRRRLWRTIWWLHSANANSKARNHLSLSLSVSLSICLTLSTLHLSAHPQEKTTLFVFCLFSSPVCLSGRLSVCDHVVLRQCWSFLSVWLSVTSQWGRSFYLLIKRTSLLV